MAINNRLLALIPVFYDMTLVILFFLVYFASKFQLERRRHELLSSRIKGDLPEHMLVSAVMISVLCVVECMYMTAVKRSSNRYLLAQMVPEREE